MCGLFTLGDGVRSIGTCGCILKGLGMGGMVCICIRRVGKFTAGAVACGVVAILKILPNLSSAFCCSTPNCVIVEAGCG